MYFITQSSKPEGKVGTTIATIICFLDNPSCGLKKYRSSHYLAWSTKFNAIETRNKADKKKLYVTDENSGFGKPEDKKQAETVSECSDPMSGEMANAPDIKASLADGWWYEGYTFQYPW